MLRPQAQQSSRDEPRGAQGWRALLLHQAAATATARGLRPSFRLSRATLWCEAGACPVRATQVGSEPQRPACPVLHQAPGLHPPINHHHGELALHTPFLCKVPQPRPASELVCGIFFPLVF